MKQKTLTTKDTSHTRHDAILEGLKVLDKELSFHNAKYGVKRFMSDHDIEDMRGDAIVEMIAAVDRYDPSKNATLKTFISVRMRGFFKDYFRKESKYKNIRLEEKSEEMSDSIHNVMNMDITKAVIILDELNIGNEVYHNMYLDIDNTDPELSQTLYDTLVELPDIKVYVILSYYILNRGIKDIAKELGMSETSGWIYRIKRQSIKYIKDQILNKLNTRS